MFSDRLFNILTNKNPLEKIQEFYNFYDDFLSKKIQINEYKAKEIKEASYSQVCKITHPVKIRRAKGLNSDLALAKTIHQITHIEFSAIELALDAAYRFANISNDFVSDFLEIAKEECEHFLMLNECLNELGFKYGDFAVHSELFNAMRASDNNFLVRMGLVHRHLEACGLDANPFVVKKFEVINHPIKSKMLENLNTILKDEVSHVSKGNKWFLKLGGNEELFKNILIEYKDYARTIKTINYEARLAAGYTKIELDNLSKIFN
ncbi:ferritin-like domain-containing protein [Campylobacter canadensis]|uniref:Ferritin-like domain-containing protein n=1 Tax=Campylobacter canadensis TaxID=449520 RepID=A0ABS7WRE5_9BACT|nr:ferritin-like domain-containing protein [Campylobacter canadensis]MBZ7987118.1 ferritin-like domain-containing protein [Campylobacter canadensis]MBZ7994528.1 ferritin-like domain-containing protein [Campylobacter canadensis]MBZ7997215.1 ferritin-like domain-containing protein [Campylobacter canadensis]MBZ7998258.1 ferritin-like domain-containing protein [Campylobacter canadensis]MBZ7999757.1 ferritin-like domain-containing protein [Campylobacter canadensis]